jgi:hypothetical protein
MRSPRTLAATAAALLALAQPARAGDAVPSCAESLPKMIATNKNDPSVSGLMVLAACYESLGKTASASAQLHDAEILSAQKNDSRIREIRGRIALLDSRVPKITVAVGGDADIGGLAIKMDGEALPRERWGQTIPIDQGQHVFEMSAPERKSRVEKVKVAAGDQPTVRVRPLDLDAPPPPVAAKVETHASPTYRTLALVLGGAGVAGIAVGAVFGVMAIGKHSDVTSRCAGFPTCPEADRAALDDLNTSAQRNGTISTIGFAAGGALLAGGALIFFAAPQVPDRSGTRGARIVPLVGRGAGGLSVEGGF